MNRLKLIAVFLLIMPYSFCEAQSSNEQIDSILLLINSSFNDSLKGSQFLEIAELCTYNQPQKSIDYANRALRMFKTIGANDGIADVYGTLFKGHLFAGSNSDSLLRYVKLMEQKLLENEDSVGMMEVHWDYAIYYGNIGQPDKEIESYLKSLELIRKFDPKPEREAQVLNNIGGLLYTNGQEKEALNYFLEGLQFAESNITKGNLLLNLGNAYMEILNKPDSAQLFIDQSIQLFEKEEDYAGIAMALHEKAAYQHYLENFEEAEKLLFQANELIKKYEVNYLLQSSYGEFAIHYNLVKDYPKAINYGKLAIAEIKTRSNYYDEVGKYYQILYESYAQVEDFENAYLILKEYHEFNDTLKNEAMLNKMEMMEAQFRIENEKSKNNLLEAEKSIALKTAQNRTYIAIAALLALFLVGTWGVRLYRSYQVKEEDNQKLESMVAERTAQLTRANKELRTLNYIASHDIKEPIRNIGTYADVIQRQLPVDLQKEFQKYFDTIRLSTSQLQSLIEDFVKYVKLSKDQNFEKVEVDLNLLLDKVSSILGLKIEENKGKIICLKPLPKVYANDSLLYTVFKNLVENGLKFNQSTSPSVEITYQVQENFVQISFTDNGIGIREDHQVQIFDLFKRLHSRQEYKGSGIGLAIVKLVMEKLGGDISLKNSSGGGSRFIITIPNLNTSNETKH